MERLPRVGASLTISACCNNWASFPCRSLQVSNSQAMPQGFLQSNTQPDEYRRAIFMRGSGEKRSLLGRGSSYRCRGPNHSVVKRGWRIIIVQSCMGRYNCRVAYLPEKL